MEDYGSEKLLSKAASADSLFRSFVLFSFFFFLLRPISILLGSSNEIKHESFGKREGRERMVKI